MRKLRQVSACKREISFDSTSDSVLLQVQQAESNDRNNFGRFHCQVQLRIAKGKVTVAHSHRGCRIGGSG